MNDGGKIAFLIPFPEGVVAQGRHPSRIEFDLVVRGDDHCAQPAIKRAPLGKPQDEVEIELANLRQGREGDLLRVALVILVGFGRDCLDPPHPDRGAGDSHLEVQNLPFGDDAPTGLGDPAQIRGDERAVRIGVLHHLEHAGVFVGLAEYSGRQVGHGVGFIGS